MANPFDAIVELMSSWTGPGLPPELLKLRRGLIGQSMEREARLGLDAGIYEILGGTIPPQCLAPELALRRAMSEVSVAFFVLEEYRQRGIEVGASIREPLVRSLVRFFKTLGDPRGAAEVRMQVDKYLASHAVAAPMTAEEYFHVIMLDCPLLDRLRTLHREGRRRRNRKSPCLDDVGLMMDNEFDDGRYNHATPLNVRTFAATGGDGVHFSLMIRDGVLSDDSPVVLTVPEMGNDGHAIVGENLREFLHFGYHTGYFCFERLIYESDPSQLLRDLLQGSAAREDFEDEYGYGQPMMRLLREEFDLQPWPDAGRFRFLQETYKPLLILPPQ